MPHKDYDTLVCVAVQNDPLTFVDALHDAADEAGNLAPMLNEAACVIANLLLDGSLYRTLKARGFYGKNVTPGRDPYSGAG